MEEPENSEVESLKEEVEELEDTSITGIPFELFEKQGNRTTKLVDTSGESRPIDGKRRWHDFRFKEPVLVTRVIVTTAGYAEHNEFEFVWETETGKERRTTSRPSNGAITFVVNDICRFVSFRPPSRFFSQTQIQGVRIEGIKREDVSSALDSLSNLDGLKQSIVDVADKVVSKADQKIAEAAQADIVRQNIAREIATLKQNASRARKNVDDLAHKKNELITENGEATRALEESNSRFRDVQQRTELLEKQAAKLASDVQTNEATLKSLRNNINLFPTEIVEFVNQGSKKYKAVFLAGDCPNRDHRNNVRHADTWSSGPDYCDNGQAKCEYSGSYNITSSVCDGCVSYHHGMLQDRSRVLYRNDTHQQPEAKSYQD